MQHAHWRGANDGRRDRVELSTFDTRRLVQKRLARGSDEAMSDAQVLLCTTTAAADKCVLRVPTIDLVVLDEAAQATAPNAWVALLG